MFRKEEAPTGGLIPREETSQAEASGMSFRVPSRNDHPVVNRPKEEARLLRKPGFTTPGATRLGSGTSPLPRTAGLASSTKAHQEGSKKKARREPGLEDA
jgi:hypothetical protein